MSDKAELLERAKLYANRNGTRIVSTVEFGHGLEGFVWVSQRDSAIKIIRNRKNYADELEAYRRLQAGGVRQLCGFAIPWLLGSDDELQAIEMEIVQKPYLLDFGKVYFDGAERRAYDRRDLQLDRNRSKSFYKPEDWSRVAMALHLLESRFGIYYADARPSNIDCGASAKDDPDWDKEPELDYSEYEDEPHDE
jgi:hypothetical protein